MNKYATLDEIIASKPSIIVVRKIETSDGSVYQLRSRKVRNFSIEILPPNSINQLAQSTYRIYLHPPQLMESEHERAWLTGYKESVVWRNNLGLDQIAEALDRGFA